MDLLNQFKDFLFSQKDLPAKVTVKNYLSDINHFIRWYESHYQKPFTPQLITHGTIEAYKKEVSGISYDVSGENESKIPNTKYQILSSSSIDRHLSSLRKFFKFLKLEGQISHNPFQLPASSFQSPASDPWHIKDFKNFLYVYNASHLTIKNYIIDTRQFFAWAENVTGANNASNTKDKNILNRIDSSLLEEYKNRLINEGNFSPATVNRKLSSLRKYLNWAEAEGLVSGISYDVSGIQKQQSADLREFAYKLQDEVKSAGSEDTKYSHLPPIRLVQKLSKAIVFAFDQTLTIPFTRAFDKASYLTWLARGKPIFAELKTKNLKPKNITSHSLLGISNLKKEFYAPLEISTKHFSWYKKTWFTLRYKRPKWYTTYHSYPIAHYFNFAILTIFMAVIGFGFYQSFFQKPTTGQPALAAFPNAPIRILSFQGRLTDNQDNPISTSSALRFAIYNAQAPASGSALLWQEVDSISPDQDGIFSVLLGNAGDCPVGQTNPTGPCGIPNWLFASNSALFLGVSVNTTPEMTPRQQLATVAFAANSETLQGLAPITQSGAGTSNVVLALDSSGNLTIGGSANPIFQASGGQFTVSGQPLLLTTNTGSNSNVTLSADGLGKIAFNKPLISTSNSNNIPSAVGSVEVDGLFSILATSSGQSAFTINQTGGGPLISASQSGTAKFTVDGSGNVTIAGGSTYSIGTSTGLSLTNACVNTTGGIVTGTGTCPGTGINWWNQLAGALSPVDTTNDLLLGSTATSSALFSYTGIKTGQTIASVSGQLIVMANNGWGGNVGIGTTTPTAPLHINRGYGSNAALIVNNLNSGDLFTASASGVTKFTVNNNGNLTFNQASAIQTNTGALTLSPAANIIFGSITQFNNTNSSDITPTTDNSYNLGNSTHAWASLYTYLVQSNGANNLELLAGSTGKLQIDSQVTTPTNTNLTLAPNGTGVIQVNSNILPNATGTLDLGSATGPKYFRNIYGTTYYSGGTVGVTASLGCVSSTLGIVTGSGSCPGGGGVNWWNQLAGALSPIDTTNDLLLGSTATSSALFSYTGIQTGHTIASVSGNLIVMANNGWGGNVGVGLTLPQARVDIKDAASRGIQGTNKITNTNDTNFTTPTGNWTTSGTPAWSINVASSGLAAKDAPGTGALTLTNAALNSAPVAGNVYRIDVDFTTTATSSGQITVSFGGGSNSFGSLPNMNEFTYAMIVTATNTNALILTPSSGWYGTIDNVYIYPMTTASMALRMESSNGTSTPVEFRTGGSGNTNIFVGEKSGYVNTSGSSNNAFGNGALARNIEGSQNNAFGANALAYNTTGWGNTAMGDYAMKSNTLGILNTAVGNSAFSNNNTGDYNVAVGDSALGNSIIGNGNVGLGESALLTNTSGNYNVAIGYNADVSSGALTNATAIGYSALVGASNSLVLGSINGINGATASVNVGIGTTAPVDTLDVRGNSGTTAVASISGKTSFAALVVDNSGTGDLITASSSAYGSNPGRTQFIVTNTGLVQARAFYDFDNSAFYLDPAATGTSLSVAGGITSGSILPMTDNTYTLGSSPSARWKSLFLGPGSLHIQCKTTDAGCPASQGIDYQFAINSAGTLGIGANLNSSLIPAFNITQGGNVGIGTTVPGNTLTVSTNNADDTIPALGSNGGKLAILRSTSGTLMYGMLLGELSSGNGYIQAQRVDGTATAYNLLLNPNGGNVGIGTATLNGAPKLQVAGATTGQARTAYFGDGLATNTNALVVGYDFTNNVGWLNGLTEGIAWRGIDLVPNGGNVVIGAAGAGSYKLDVSGTTNATGLMYGNGKEMFQTSDTWLRLNNSNAFTSGIYAGTGILRTDGNFQVGAGGADFNVTSAGAVTVASTLTVAGVTNANGGLSQGGNVILNGSDTWLRTTGATGWYNATYGGGIYMSGTSAVQVYNAKSFDVPASAGVGYISSGNYGGTGTAAYFPTGLWANGTTEWIYGSVIFNGALSGATSFSCSNCITQADVGASAIGTSETKTGLGSNATAANTGENILMSDYSFFPSLTDTSVTHQHCVAYWLNQADPGNYYGRIHPSNTDCAGVASTGTATTRWRYITASDHPTIWAIVDATGNIANTWEAEDPVNPTKWPENPNPLEGTELKPGQYFLSPEFPSVPEIKKVYDALPANESTAIIANLKSYIVDKRHWLNDLTSINDLENITPRYYHSGRQWAYRYLADYFNTSPAELLELINTVADGKLYTVADPVGTINAWKEKETARIKKETQDAAVSKTASGSADLAEWYSTYATNLEPGDVLGVTGSNTVGKAQQEFSKRIIGVISTSPDKVMGNKQLDSDVSIALNGRAPTKVSSENGPIEPGDPLTISSIPGVAAKAIKAGNVIGKALESYSNTDPTAIGKINVFVNLSWYDPDVYLTHADVKNFSIAIASPSSDLKIPSYYSINDILGKPIERVGIFSGAVIANLKIGAINAQEIATNALNVTSENITINGQNFRDYIAGIVQNVLNNGSYISPIASTDQINTNLISPLATGSAVAIKLDNNKISILNSNSASGSAVASIDNQGNATFSGSLTASSSSFLTSNIQNLTTGDATISGTLHAGKILASDIVGLNIQATTVSANYITNVTNIYNSTASASNSNSNFGLISGAITPGTPSSNFQFTGLASNNFINIATFSSQLAYVDNLNAATASFSQGLMVFGPTSLSDTSIVGQLSIDGNLILSSNSINVLGGDLQIQPLKQGGLSVMAGLFYIDTSGNLTVGGDATFAKNVTVKGTLAANTISPIPGNDLTLETGNSNLEVKNASNSSTLSLNNLGDLVASGSGTFGKLNLSLIQPAFALSTTEVVATGSAGTAQINAHQTEITIDNPLVTDKSLIYVTPKSNQVIYLMRQIPGVSFTVGVSIPTYTDIPFNWIIVN